MHPKRARSQERIAEDPRQPQPDLLPDGDNELEQNI